LDPNYRNRLDAMRPRSPSGSDSPHAPVETPTLISGGRYPVTREWHALSSAEVAKLLDVNPDEGLSDTEARGRLTRVGANVVGEHPETPLWRLALAQFRSLVVLLLLAAAVIAAALGERVESVAILAALLLNAGIGFFTEWRARISLAKLRTLTVPEALVRREGAIVRIPAAHIVPGDLLVLEAGAHVPADARLIRSSRLQTAEAALTGESAPVDKDAEARLAPETALADRRPMVYLGTTVVAGSGLAVVTATGLATELGRIGQLVALAGERATPLEGQVEQLGRRLMGFALATCGLVGLAGILHGQPLGLMLETAITLAIAAVPEGLPAVTTVALAAGLWRLARAGALVRRLPAVETLGSTTVICSDKTGTLTENRMTVSRLVVEPETIDVVPRTSGHVRDFVQGSVVVDPLAQPRLARLLTVGALVNDASVTGGPGSLGFQGDPTEIALLAVALDAGLDPVALAHQWPRRGEVPFDPAVRLMATFHESEDGGMLCVKGAPAAVLEASVQYDTPAGGAPLTPDIRAGLLESNRTLARKGLRVLAMAWRPDGWKRPVIEGLTFLGFAGLEDPLRSGVREAIARCAEAGIRTIMLTGDQRATAEAIGNQLGLVPESIRSRVSPQDKLDLVATLQAEGEIVAMTGDGVNDAPALARADIGIAMGRHGTDIAREAADIVLTDDNFATITRAVQEGRVIYANLRKVIHFLFTCNLSEILAVFVAISLGFPSPLLPLQILWVNLVTDILPAMALIRDPAEPDVMHRPPRDRRDALVTWRLGRRMLAEGALLSAGVLGAYLWAVWQDGPGARANTIAFVALVLIHPLQAMNCRSARLGWWQLPPNGLSWIALATLWGIQWTAVSWTPLMRLLGTVSLSLGDWLLVTLWTLSPVLLLEMFKAIRTRVGRHALVDSGAVVRRSIAS
jgi:Ca2+-transporting ATPase